MAKVGKRTPRWPVKSPVHPLRELCAEDKKKNIYITNKTYTNEQTPQLTGALREAAVLIYVIPKPVSAARENFKDV